MWEVKANYERKGLGNRFPMCQSEEDTTEHVLEFNKGDKKFKLNEERGKEWGEIVEIYGKNKKSRSIDNIGEERHILEEQKKREDSRRRQMLRGDRYQRRRKCKKEAEELKDSKAAVC